MDRGSGAAARLPGRERRELAVQALAGAETVTGLATRHGVSRKFVYQQTHKASIALNDAFAPAVPDSAVLFELAVSKAWLHQIIIALALICRGSYRGAVEFLRDLLGVTVSLGGVHDVLRAAARQASAINRDQDLSCIRVGLHDELFQGAMPVLAGVDAHSAYCYILAAAERRDADTWGVHLLDAAAQRLRPDYTIADAGQGLRAGQRAAWGETPCHGDVFHIVRQGESLANALRRLAQGATSRRKALQAGIGRTGRCETDHEVAAQLQHAREAEAQAHQLAGDVRLLLHWLRHDVLALAGPDLATRRELFDFLVTELAAREPADTRRLRPVRVALQNQRDHLLAFAGVLDAKLAVIACVHTAPEPLVRDACLLHRLPTTSPAYWQGWNRLRIRMRNKLVGRLGSDPLSCAWISPPYRADVARQPLEFF